MTPFGGKSYFTAAELAELKLPGLSGSKRKINERAADERWALKFDAAGVPLHRQRAGRGGGVEYHHSLLPASARVELAKRGLAGSAEVSLGPPPELKPASLWPWYEAQTDKVKAEASRRLAILDKVGCAEMAGLTRTAAVALVAGDKGCSTSTLWGWFRLVEGVAESDWLPHLAPRRKGGGAEAEVSDTVWQALKSDWLRPEQPTWAACYDRALVIAAGLGVEIPCSRTLYRKLEREVQAPVIVMMRKGDDALRQTLPPQRRTVEQLHAMRLVNIDGHKWDVFVRFPDGTVQRPIMVAIQDVYSRKLLAWRFGQTESAVLTRLAFADLFRDFGIPGGCLLDNGRAFASKWITGGAKTRFRFKIREDEPTGLLPSLGINPHWAMPYRGSSKPIERTFGIGGLSDAVARGPYFAGAYTGNRPDAKPDNYGDKAIRYADFVQIANREIARLNAKPGRRTEMARGVDSFDAVFDRSYAVSVINKATPEQLRLALLTAEEVTTDRKSGAIEPVQGSRYWTPELAQIAGSRVVVRFDPDDLTLPAHVYSRDGRYIVSAPLWGDTQFLDVGAAKDRARLERNQRKATREASRMQDLIEAQDVAALLGDPANYRAPDATVVRPVRHRGGGAAAARVANPQRAHQAAILDRIGAAATRLRVVD